MSSGVTTGPSAFVAVTWTWGPLASAARTEIKRRLASTAEARVPLGPVTTLKGGAEWLSTASVMLPPANTSGTELAGVATEAEIVTDVAGAMEMIAAPA